MSPQTRKRSQFRPCIDLHAGQVKQIVGGTLSEESSTLKTNFVARCVQSKRYIRAAEYHLLCSHPPRYFAELYRGHNLEGGHVIMLGKGNEEAAREALAAWPGTSFVAT